MTRYLHLVVAVVFSCFAWVQLDDPDNFLWIVIYGIVALNAILVFAGKGSRNFSSLITLFILLCLILNTRGFLVWWHAGQPSIMSESAAGEEIR